MKLAGDYLEERVMTDWHLWFAWYPVGVGRDETRNREDVRWLEWVERRQVVRPVYGPDGPSVLTKLNEYRGRKGR